MSPRRLFVVCALQSDMDSRHGQCARSGTFGRRLCGCNNIKLHHHGTAEVHTKISVWALQWFVALRAFYNQILSLALVYVFFFPV